MDLLALLFVVRSFVRFDWSYPSPWRPEDVFSFYAANRGYLLSRPSLASVSLLSTLSQLSLHPRLAVSAIIAAKKRQQPEKRKTKGEKQGNPFHPTLNESAKNKYREKLWWMSTRK